MTDKTKQVVAQRISNNGLDKHMDPVLSRRSIRKYTNQPVSEESLRLLLKAAMVAPSAGDERPWHFVVIRRRNICLRMMDIHPHAHMLKRAPVSILICGDETLQKLRGFWVQDCAAATENILIEAQQLKLGAVWLGIYPMPGKVEAFRRLLNIPTYVVPFALVVVGHPAEHKEPAERFDESRVHRDYW